MLKEQNTFKLTEQKSGQSIIEDKAEEWTVPKEALFALFSETSALRLCKCTKQIPRDL